MLFKIDGSSLKPLLINVPRCEQFVNILYHTSNSGGEVWVTVGMNVSGRQGINKMMQIEQE